MQLDQLVVQGKLLDAIQHFFHPDVVCYSDPSDAIYGKEAKYNNMRHFLEGVAEINNITLHSQALGDRVTMSEMTFEFTRHDQKKVVWNEVIRRFWKDGLVIDEKYYNCECNRTEGPMPLQVGFTASSDPLLPQKLIHLDQLVSQGNFLEAIDQYFHPEVVCQSNPTDAIYGKQTKYDLIRHFLRGVAQINNCTLHSHAVGGQVTMSEHTFEFTQHDGNKLVWNEVIRRYWKDGLVIDEKYYTCDCNKDGQGEPHATSENAPYYNYTQDGFIGFTQEASLDRPSWAIVSEDLASELGQHPQAGEIVGINPAFKRDMERDINDELSVEMEEPEAYIALAENQFTWETQTVLGETLGEPSYEHPVLAEIGAEIVEPQVSLNDAYQFNWQTEAQTIVGETLGEPFDGTADQALDINATIFEPITELENKYDLEGEIAGYVPSFQLITPDVTEAYTEGFEGTIDGDDFVHDDFGIIEAAGSMFEQTMDEIIVGDELQVIGEYDVLDTSMRSSEDTPNLYADHTATEQVDAMGIISLFYPSDEGTDINPEYLMNLGWINTTVQDEPETIVPAKQEIGGDPFFEELSDNFTTTQGSLFDLSPESESYSLQTELPFYETDMAMEISDLVVEPVETIFDSTGAVNDFTVPSDETSQTPLFGEVIGDLDLIMPIEQIAAVHDVETPVSLSDKIVFSKVAFVGQEIPDGFGALLLSAIEMEEVGKVEEMGINIDIEHPFIQDLIVKLYAPSGASTILHNREGVLDDSIRDIKRWYGKEYFATFYGESIEGNWTLEISDNSKRDIGKLNQWSLYLLPQREGQTSIFVNNPLIVEPESETNFSAGEESLKENEVFGHFPRLMGENLQRQDILVDEAIPDNTGALVSRAKFVSNKRVEQLDLAIDIQHPCVGDLIVNLIAPSGKALTVHNREGGYTENLTRYYGQEFFEVFQGEPVAGDWRLEVFDKAITDVGRLKSWSIGILTGDVEIPAEKIILEPVEENTATNYVTNTPGVMRGADVLISELRVDMIIPDDENNPLITSIAMPQTGLVKNLGLFVDIEHPFCTDLKIILEAPSGNTAIVYDREGGFSNNMIHYYNDEYFPELLGESIEGNWTLKVYDFSPAYSGKLNAWKLYLFPA
ncbi:MAG: hypothetical protein HC892_10630 [Saprospiraceae bacterium]|nr:hypothetical protein [Saprospiraceae bacterium]